MSEEQGPSEQQPTQDATPPQPPSSQDAPQEPSAPPPTDRLPDFKLEVEFKGAEPIADQTLVFRAPEIEVERNSDE